MSEADSQSEPSMDEILASIRRIIADEEAEDPTPAPANAAAPVRAQAEERAEEAPETPGPEDSAIPDEAVKMPALSSAASRGKTEDEEILDLTRMVTDDGQIVDISEKRSASPGLTTQPGLPSRAPPEPLPVAEPQPGIAAPAVAPEALISSQAAEEATSSLAAVVQTASSRKMAAGPPPASSKSIEDLVQAALTPLLKSWLDENLPPVVERVAREEIQKLVSRVEGS